MADTGAGAAGFDGGFSRCVPHDHDVPDVVGSQVGVPEDQVAWSLLAGSDADAVTGSEPAALRGGEPWQSDIDLCVRGLGEAGAVPNVRARSAHLVGVAVVALCPGEDLPDAVCGERRDGSLVAADSAAVVGVAEYGATAVARGVEQDIVGIPVDR